MADKLISVYVGDARHYEGNTVNVYDSYTNALAHAATGLSTIKAVSKLTGAAGSAISQVAKTTGLTVDQSGCINFYIDDGNTSVFLMSDGQWGLPRVQYVAGL